MDICAHIGLSVSKDVNSLGDLRIDALESTHRVLGDLSVDELGNGLSEFLKIQDDQQRVSGSILPSGKHEVENKDICGDSNRKFTTVSSDKGLSKSASFPCSSSKIMSSAGVSMGGGNDGEASDGADGITTEVLIHNGNAKSVSLAYQRSISIPTPLKLVSAMKGSREKEGAEHKKLTVKWAPDVYDPVPTAVSHVVTNKPQRHSSKKNAKNKHKGGGHKSSSHGSKGKDKRQGARKHGGSSSNNRGFKFVDYDEKKVVDFCEPQPSQSRVDFHVVGNRTDQFCGSSFFKKSVTSLHFSVAEAT